MKNIEQLFTRAWYQNKSWIFILLPLEFSYRALMAIRKFFYGLGLFKSSHPGVPVIIVGNISIGGTGKTPVVIELVNHLKKSGWTPGVLSRGYGGSKQNQSIVIDDETSTETCGDEPLLIHRNSQAMVVVDRLRSRGADYLVNKGCDIIVADDGLQHLALKRDYEIIVVDGERRFGNEHLLPVGPLRESTARLQHCDFILSNGNCNLPVVDVASDHFIIEAKELVDIRSKKTYPISWLESREVHALAGIGNPQRFFNLLNKLGASIIDHPFPDHHNFRMSDIPNDKKSLIVTEKDAVKLEKFELQDCFYLKIRTELPENFLSHIDAFLTSFQKLN